MSGSAYPRGILRNEHSKRCNLGKTVRFGLPTGTTNAEPNKKQTYFANGERHPMAGDPVWRAQHAMREGNTAVDKGLKFIALKASASNPPQVPLCQSTKASQVTSARPLFTSKNFPILGSREPTAEKFQGPITWGAVVSNPPPAAPVPSKSSGSTYSGPKRLVATRLVNINFEADFLESLQEEEDTYYGDVESIYDFG